MRKGLEILAGRDAGITPAPFITPLYSKLDRKYRLLRAT